MAQLLWMPPTVPLYKPGAESIFEKHTDYSKIVVFAEYRVLQRGVALLLSDYSKELNKRNGIGTPERFPNIIKNIPNFIKEQKVIDGIREFSLTKSDYRDLTLDELISKLQNENEWNELSVLTALAYPEHIARQLSIEEEAEVINNAFFEYLTQDGVVDALWTWIVDNGYDNEKDWINGILRYCAEGNLYAVMEEWKTLFKLEKDETIAGYISNVLEPGFKKEECDTPFRGTIVNVQTHETTTAKYTPLMGYGRQCSFADRLTGDVTEVGSGEDEKKSKILMRQFTSPFWPMVMVCGRGAQEGLDFHQYCSRIMHLTLPRGAVSYDQRRGRIDRFRSLLVRRRAAEMLSGIRVENNNTSNMINRLFNYLANHKNLHPRYDSNSKTLMDQIYPNWHIPDMGSKYHFEEILPAWPYTEENVFIVQLDAMLESYRRPMGVGYKNTDEDVILDLSAGSEDL